MGTIAVRNFNRNDSQQPAVSDIGGQPMTRGGRKRVVAGPRVIPLPGHRDTRSAPGPAAPASTGALAGAAGVSRWHDNPLFKYFALAALGIWALAGCWDIAGAFIEHRQGASIASLTAAIVLLAALLSSIAGFAFSALAGSALAYLQVEPLQAVQSMVLWSTASQLYAVWKIRDSVRWGPLWPVIAAGMLTVPLGVWLLRHVDGSFYAMGLGLFLMAYGGYAVVRRENRVVRGSPWIDAATGALGGIMGGLAGLPGPFVTIWCSLRGWDKLRQRAVYQPYILAMQLMTIACLQWQAPARVAVPQAIAFVPFALLGAIAGLAVFQRLSNTQFQKAVSVLLVVSGLGLLARAL